MHFIFTDIEGSSRLWSDHGDRMAECLRRHDAIIMDLIHTHEGLLVKHTGDGVFAVFEGGDPLGFAVGLVERVSAEPWESIEALRVRVGISAGTAQRWASDFFGPVVNRAARLSETAAGGQIIATGRAIAEGTVPVGAELTDLGPYLFHDLGEPERLYQLTPPGAPHSQFPALESPLVRPHTLPVDPTPFIGRERELRGLQAIFEQPEHRLLTLVGQGGVGKTRLALRLASALTDRFTWGVYFVPLSAVTEPAHLPSAVAESLRFTFQDNLQLDSQLVNYVSDKDLLLILDNFEHLMDAIPLVTRLLSECPRVRIVTTSRERLLLPGEQVFEVRGMAYPESVDDSMFEDYGAPRLFLEAGRRCDQTLALSPLDRDALLRICRLTEGLPLALELAASWVRTLGLLAIAERLETAPLGFDFRMRGIPERHRSLGAVLDYSFRLLPSEEQALLRHLSVFRGAFSKDAAERIAGASLETLAALVDKSLLRRHAPSRFELLDLTRCYARTQLDECPTEAAATTGRFVAYYARFLKEQTLLRHDTEAPLARSLVASELENIRAAWRAALSGRDAEVIAEFLEPFYWFLRAPGWDAEGCETFTNAVSVLETCASGEPADEGIQWALARARIRLGHFKALLFEFDDSARLLRLGLCTARRFGLNHEVALALQTLGRLWFVQGRLGRSRRAFEISAAWWRTTGDRVALVTTLTSLGRVASDRGDHRAARSLLCEAQSLAAGLPARIAAYIGFNLGLIEQRMGDLPAARLHLEESLRLSVADGDPALISHVGDALGEVYMIEKDFVHAQSLFEENMKTRRRLGDPQLIACTAARLARLSNLRGNHPEARAWAREGMSSDKARSSREWSLDRGIQEAWAQLMLEGPAVARDTLAPALKEAADRCEMTSLAEALMVFAMILKAEGERSKALAIVHSIRRSPPEHWLGLWASELQEQWRKDSPGAETGQTEQWADDLDWRTLREESV